MSLPPPATVQDAGKLGFKWLAELGSKETEKMKRVKMKGKKWHAKTQRNNSLPIIIVGRLSSPPKPAGKTRTSPEKRVKTERNILHRSGMILAWV